METTIGRLADGGHSTAFERHLRAHVHQYFPKLHGRPIEIQLISEQPRETSTLYRYQLSAGELRRSVLIKTPSAQEMVRPLDPSNGGSERPRMAAKANPRIKQSLEYATLLAIQHYFGELGDPRFGAVNALGYLPEYGALIMEEVNTPNLRQRFARKNRLLQLFDSTELHQAFHNAGAWLRHYQRLPKQADVQVRHATRAEYIDSIIRYTNYLQGALNNEPFFKGLEKWTIMLANATLPSELPMGLGHGDYAMRNILVDKENCITVLDTLGRWRVPVYEDIGYFLIRLKTFGPQILSLGHAYSSADIANYEKHFLHGYFDTEPVPFTAIRLFEIQALLDNWSSHIARLSHNSPTKRAALMNWARLAISNRFFQKLLYSLIDIRSS